jgi:hypothetical protein
MRKTKIFLRILVLAGITTFLGNTLWLSVSFGQAAAPLADLVVSFKAPATAYQGEVIAEKIKITVRNKGGLEAKNFHVDIILKEISKKLLTTEHMCGRGYIMSLKPGKSISTPSAMQLPVSIPGDIQPGKYQLCAVVDSTHVVRESSERNNRVCQNITIKEKREPKSVKLPDLKVIHTATLPPGDLRLGQVIKFKVTVKNLGKGIVYGTVRAGGSVSPNGYMIDLSLSKKPIKDPVRPHIFSPVFKDGMLLKGGRISRTKDLAPGASKMYSASVEIPKDTPPGKYWIGVSLDPFNKVIEGSPTGEENNTVNHGIRIK